MSEYIDWVIYGIKYLEYAIWEAPVTFCIVQSNCGRQARERIGLICSDSSLLAKAGRFVYNQLLTLLDLFFVFSFLFALDFLFSANEG